jgi:hypothetical protein
MRVDGGFGGAIVLDGGITLCRLGTGINIRQ